MDTSLVELVFGLCAIYSRASWCPAWTTSTARGLGSTCRARLSLTYPKKRKWIPSSCPEGQLSWSWTLCVCRWCCKCILLGPCGLVLGVCVATWLLLCCCLPWWAEVALDVLCRRFSFVFFIFVVLAASAFSCLVATWLEQSPTSNRARSFFGHSLLRRLPHQSLRYYVFQWARWYWVVDGWR